VSARVGGRSPIPTLMGLALICAAFAVVLISWALKPSAPTGIDPARVYRLCAQYASLDLSGMASLCKDAGYQQLMPEDLDR